MTTNVITTEQGDDRINKNRCSLCNDIIPHHLGVYLGGKLYCCQQHAEKGFIGSTYKERR